jgi:hypothetical protein
MNSARPILVALAMSIALGFAAEAYALVPAQGWDSTIILRGAERTAVKSMPIENRPNRPLHVYGNTVRRLEHRAGAPAAAGGMRRR